MAFLNQATQIWGNTPPKNAPAYVQSKQYATGVFANSSPTPLMLPGTNTAAVAWRFLTSGGQGIPEAPLPAIHTDLAGLDRAAPTLVWLGHSSYWLGLPELTMLVDPVLTQAAVPFVSLKPFAGTDAYGPQHIPPVDVLLLTHDHYDHLDYGTVTALRNRVGRVVCPLGVGAHLHYWGYPAEKITELDWWDALELHPRVRLTATPARHFSGRTLKRGHTLWASFVLEAPSARLHLGGDSGYDAHFKEIGARFGRFDLAVLECGQYNTQWPYIHMMPEQTVQAAQDLNATLALPVHWGKFRLSLHAWHEPITRFSAAADAAGVAYTTPHIGEPLVLGGKHPQHKWWQGLR
jgi:L-ascorbate metabolism protein UlaG (beta-lactamase superfamily)